MNQERIKERIKQCDKDIEALQNEKKKLEEQKRIKEGDYGFDGSNPFIAIKNKSGRLVQRKHYNGGLNWDCESANIQKIYGLQILGNIFDDLKENRNESRTNQRKN